MKSKLLLLKRLLTLIAILQFVSINSLWAQTYVSIGTGSLTNTNISYPAPYGNFFYGARHQFLILASELTTAGVPSNSVISQLGFNVQIPAGQPLQAYSIKMAATAATTLSTTFIEAGLIPMFDPLTYTTTTGWNTHTFTNGGFVWDGTSNLLVDVCFNNTSWTTNAITYYTTTATTRASFRYADAQGNCTDPGYLTSTARPNMRLTVGGVNIPPPIAPLANYQFVLGVDTLWERSPSILTNTSTYQDKSYWDITGYNDDSVDGVWDPYYTVRQPNAWGTWIDTIGNVTNFNHKFPLAGYYKVKLLCVNLFGVSQIEKVVYVARPTGRPVPYFFASKLLVGTGDGFQFFDASSNGPTGWSWWLDPPCITCGANYNEFFPSNDIPRPVLNANDGGIYTVCMAVWNDIGGDTICRQNYIEIIDGYENCNDSVTKSVKGTFHSAWFDTYTTRYYSGTNCNPATPGLRIAPCADTIYVFLEQLKLRTQDTVELHTGGFNGPLLRKWGGNNIAAYPDTSKVFKYVGQELFGKFRAGTPNSPPPNYIADSGYVIRWASSPATFPAPTASFTCLDTVYSGYKMTMSNTTQGTNLAFAWDMNGDGFYGLDNPTFPDSISVNPSYTFYTFLPITKKICLRATNCRGANVMCKNVAVLPIQVAPIADFTVDKTSGFTTDTFRFTDISQYGASSWKWTISPSTVSFINGTTPSSQNPMVVFGAATNYDITLEATNPFGTTSKTKLAYISTLSYSNPGSIYPPQSSDLDIGISRVFMLGSAGKIDTITPLKDAAYHSYYLSSQAVVYRGGTYYLDVYRESNKDPMNARVWIDFNRNTDYTDPGELIYSENGKNNIKIPTSFTVPNNAIVGLTRMLIGVSPDFSTITPTLATLGVYEDHGLIVAQDLVRPIVVLKGGEVYKTEVGQPFVDPGYTATDNIEGDITPRVVEVGNVDITRLGYYKRKYYVLDNYNNVSDTVYRMVQVEISTIPPVLTLFGSDTVKMEVYDKFPEDGFEAKDHSGNFITQYVVIGGTLDTAHIGDYVRTYSITDAFGNKATDSRVVYVRDLTKPVIECRLGANVDTVVHEIKTPYEDNDYIKVTDNYWKNIQYSRSGILNINKRGIYMLRYDAVDGSSNKADSFILFVHIKSTQPPFIKLNGEPDIIINVFGTYVEKGATATDYEGNPLSVVITTNLKTDSLGDYIILYTAKDQDGNIVTTQRTVHVRDSEPPVIQLLGNDPYYWVLGNSPYIDPGVKVTDNYYPKDQVKVDSNFKQINVFKEGQYTAVYNANDPSGNVAAEKTRVVIVVPNSIGINEALKAEGFAVYPNPASNVLNVDIRSGEIVKLNVWDIQGKEVKMDSQTVASGKYVINTGNNETGLYLLRIETSDGRILNSKFTVIK